jgi:hypothetical protein
MAIVAIVTFWSKYDNHNSLSIQVIAGGCLSCQVGAAVFGMESKAGFPILFRLKAFDCLCRR